MIESLNKTKSLPSAKHDVNEILPVGLAVKRKSDGVLGIIEKFGHRFGAGNNAYNAYYVRWADGKIGFPNESDFETCA